MVDGRLHSYSAVTLTLRAWVSPHFWTTAEDVIYFDKLLVSACWSCEAKSVSCAPAVELIVTALIGGFVFVCLEAGQSVRQLHRWLGLGILEASAEGWAHLFDRHGFLARRLRNLVLGIFNQLIAVSSSGVAWHIRRLSFLLKNVKVMRFLFRFPDLVLLLELREVQLLLLTLLGAHREAEHWLRS